MQERELLSTQPQLPTVAMTLWQLYTVNTVNTVSYCLHCSYYYKLLRTAYTLAGMPIYIVREG